MTDLTKIKQDAVEIIALWNDRGDFDICETLDVLQGTIVLADEVEKLRAALEKCKAQRDEAMDRLVTNPFARETNQILDDAELERILKEEK
jgi:TATA-binding protein-associated factor Taf7